jgi:hypothetical protein
MSNHAWIRLRSKHSRALRFVSFQPLELLRVHGSLAASMSPAEYGKARKNLEKQRRAVRHLFRFRDGKGKMQWARSWAAVPLVNCRMAEVRSSEAPDQPDPFLYGLYSWISSAVHGGPNSINDMFHGLSGALVPKRHPERDPTAQFAGAAAALAHTLSCAAEDLKLRAAVGKKVDLYSGSVQGLRNRPRPEHKAA